MNRFIKRGSIVLVTAGILAGCASESDQQAADSQQVEEPAIDNQDTAEEASDVAQTVDIEGLQDHYHTGDKVKLIAKGDGAAWQWVDGNDQVIGDSEMLEIDAKDGLQVKAQALDDNDQIIGESDLMEIHIDDHHGTDGDEVASRIYSGFFYNDEIEARELSDWEGQWQSVHTYLADGDLDEVMEHKAEAADDPEKTAEYYKEYYTKGYETDIQYIDIHGSEVTFTDEEGEQQSADYEHDGHEVLEYERGNRGVRFVFKRVGDNDKMPKYIQFSDHAIAPQEALHYHLYWGDDRQELLDEVEHWPTYYPIDYTIEQIKADMMAH
ncbi:ZinT/AdcA family metal-binding protein [Dolosigranulum pigrum]|uniref:ZinT/AdcA family metal-binding protein n=1 Tax=Dolosigranulum pigrum TaxID=29394 RepID=UPI000DC2BD14|nr:ZinT/AdcA family metal-binding protein [Dolosigranulum pigrum]QJS96904.1 metal-binding protein ZinT [Dolosigranulum pigrum]QTJ35873.1 metal-binding protein ZinT [Dolosigranulum pigrum]